MSKRAYNLQKGRQLQALHESVEGASSHSNSSSKGRVARDVAKIRDLCPPGTDDDRLVELVEKARGDSGLMESAISELWEDYRGGAQDEWATVEKKGKKKNDSWSTPARRDGPKRQPQPQKQQTAGDEEAPADDRAAANRGRGSGVRGRGAPAARGGRGGGRGRGRGAAPRSGSTRATQNDESGDDDAEVAGESSQDQPQKTQKTEQAAPVAPTPVIPHLTGAWTKKPSFVVAAKPKPAAPAPAPKPAAEKPKEAAAPAATATTAAASPAPAPVSSPKKTAKEPSSPAPAATETAEAAPSPKKKAASPKKVQSPVAKTPEVKPAAAAEKVASPKAEKPVESASISTWGSLDVSTSAIGDWSASASSSTEKKGASTPNAWARGSPIVTAENAQTSIPTVSPGSPKDLVSPAESRAAGSAASPKYLKLGRWDTGVATNLSLQFGSFSLNGVEHVESSSPAGWASTTTATSATKTTAKAAETQNVWGTQSASPKKKAPLSPARATEETVHERKSAVTTSAPPGLSVESGRATPKGSQSPRTFAAPSAPSPASLPKPDEVKRSTPNRNQSAFQATAQAQQSKIGAGSTYAADFGAKSSTLYQASYGQYSMGIGAAGNQGQMASTSGTPKSGPSRAAAAAPASAQSPSHAAQQQSAQQYQQQAQAQPQQQKPAAQQGAQAQTPAQQQPQQQQGQGHHQGHPHHHQAGPPGYHPHYAPPPPPGMAMAYNPYNYASYYQGYGYYQNPQYAQYSPRTQYPPRGSIPYGVEGPMPGFSNPPNVPVGYQDQHLLAHQHDYPGAMPQGFGEVSGAYLQQGGHHHHLHQQNGPQSHGKGASQISSSTQQPRSGAAGMQGYQASSGAGARDHAASTPPVPNPAAAGASGAAAYGQHYGWASYGNQPMGGWGHMMHQGYQAPTQHQQHSGSHQQSYRQYSGNNAQAGASASDANSGNAAHGHAWSS